jgi:hypothetical protein
MAFGDMEWAQRGGGLLTWWERLAQVGAVVRFRVGQRLRRRPALVGARSAAEIDRMMAETELPRTGAVARAASLVAQLGPPSLAGHALRTYAWGTLLGLRDGLAWDRDVFALAALLHDLALARRTPNVACFAADGAAQSVALLEEWGVDARARRTVGDAICLHVRVEVPTTLGVEAHLVQRGAGVDVLGLGLAEVEPELQARVLERHPRGDLVDFLVDAFGRDVAAHPGTRMGLWVRHGFLERVRAAPFPRAPTGAQPATTSHGSG